MDSVLLMGILQEPNSNYVNDFSSLPGLESIIYYCAGYVSRKSNASVFSWKMARHHSMLNLKRTMISTKRTKKPMSRSCPWLTAEDWCIHPFLTTMCAVKLHDEIFATPQNVFVKCFEKRTDVSKWMFYCCSLAKMNIPFNPFFRPLREKLTVKNFLTNINMTTFIKIVKDATAMTMRWVIQKLKNCPTILECLQEPK